MWDSYHVIHINLHVLLCCEIEIIAKEGKVFIIVSIYYITGSESESAASLLK